MGPRLLKKMEEQRAAIDAALASLQSTVGEGRKAAERAEAQARVWTHAHNLTLSGRALIALLALDPIISWE